MNAKQFAIAHGEKVALGVIAVGVLWWISSVSSDADTIPKGELSTTDVRDKLEEVKKVRTNAVITPNLVKPTDYHARMAQLLAQPVAAEPRLAWLSVPPDIGPRTGNKPFFYVYETQPVAITATDKVGTVELTITLPATDRKPEAVSRVFNAPELAITRENNAIVNRLRWVGVQIQTSTNEGDWQPLSGPGVRPGGIIPIEAAKSSLTLSGMIPWTSHSYRARLLLAATSFVSEKQRDRSLLIYEGRFAPDADPTGIQTIRKLVLDLWPEGTDQSPAAEVRRQAILNQFQQPESATTAAQAGLTVAKNESLFTGPWGPAWSVVVTHNIRFALLKGFEDKGTFGIMKHWDKYKAWDKEPRQFRGVVAGAAIGEPVTALPPVGSEKVPADYSTGMIAQGYQKVVRTWYYEATIRQRPGSKGKDLVIVPKVNRNAYSATVSNPATGDTFDALQLDPIPPSLAPLASLPFDLAQNAPVKEFKAVYPAIFAFGYNEPEIFAANPTEFRSFGMAPTEPKRHAPGTGPLPKLKQGGLGAAETDTDYIEFPDGRIIWLNHLNAYKLMMWVPKDVVLPTEKATAPVVPDATKPTTPTVPQPPRVTPGSGK